MEAFFEAVPGTGPLLFLHHSPGTASVLGAVLYVHPWAEEMNKSRRMAAKQARSLAEAGFAVLQIDLRGCGDSAGDFSQASWSGWIEDVHSGAQWLQARYKAPLWLWGLRSGALLATAAANRVMTDCRLLLWQPAVSGKPLLQQFLRLKAAADLEQGDAKTTMEAARREIAAGREVDVAGYRLSPELAAGLEQATLDLPGMCRHTVWIELSNREEPTLLPASHAKVAAWRTEGQPMDVQVVPGPAFWQTQEIEDAPALLQATTTAMLKAASP